MYYICTVNTWRIEYNSITEYYLANYMINQV